MSDVFRQLLGSEYEKLPTAVQEYHDHRHTHYTGTAFSGGNKGALARTVRGLFGFPEPAEDMPVEITLSVEDGRDRWHRRFGTRRFSSSFHVNPDGSLDEKFGPFRFAFRLRCDGDRMYWDFARWSCLGLPMPRALGPRVETYETESEDGAFEFYSHADFPIMGRLVHYHGKVRPTPETS